MVVVVGGLFKSHKAASHQLSDKIPFVADIETEASAAGEGSESAQEETGPGPAAGTQ